MPLTHKNEKKLAEQQNLAATGGAPATTLPGQGVSTTGHVNPTGSNLPGPAPFTAGPHKHDILNKLDPRVDSQSGGMQVLGSGFQAAPVAGSQAYSQVNQPSHVPATGSAVPATGAGGHAYGTGVGTTTGVPHKSRVANELDPRVDTTNTHTGRHAMTGGAGMPASGMRDMPEGTYGPHSTRMGNALDPRVDSDADHRAAGFNTSHAQATHANTPRTHAGQTSQVNPTHPPGVGGPAPTTAGPHKHDILNKLDPSVNSRQVSGVDSTGRRVI